ncbi:MAG: DUF3828 domain-containing protein [Candidatus Eremiobacteraeota bacterium]|nr:DUF3828 domain-containing protein [Candidatus Eremiobacteraeota bacterium]
MKKRLALSFLVLLVLAMTFSPAQAAEKTPAQVLDGFYKWYFKNVPAIDPVKGPEHKPFTYRDNFSQAKDFFQPDLYRMLSMAFTKGPSDGDWIDFDPFINAQMGARGYKMGKSALKGNRATVTVSILPGRGSTWKDIPVELTKSGGTWRISNYLYDKDFDLYRFLKKMKYFKE